MSVPIEYLPSLTQITLQGILQGGTFEPRDIFWGQLASSLECINSGTTTVVDHSHMNISEDHRTFYHGPRSKLYDMAVD